MMKSVLSELEQNVDPAYRCLMERHFNMDVRGFLGVPTPVVRKISAKIFKELRFLPIPDVLVFCEEALETRVYECKIIAFDWAFRSRRSLGEQHLPILERWLNSYVDDWPDCDDLCTHALGYLLAENPRIAESALKWTSSDNRWMRRASAVCLIYGLRRGLLLDFALQVAERLVNDSDRLVQKGYGWMLKEASKCHPEEVFGFVMKHQRGMPRSSLRYAIEKFPDRLRQEALGRRTCSGQVQLSDYQHDWPDLFEKEKSALLNKLGPWLHGPIEHVGSTAVPGLKAKPIIDIMAGVKSLDSSVGAIDVLQSSGYCYYPYKADVMHWFCKPTPEYRTHHLHLVPYDSPLWQERIKFRDILRSNEKIAEEYEQLKVSLARDLTDDRESYTKLKWPFIEGVLREFDY